jgi:hypothetical protein
MKECELDSFVPALGTYETERLITLVKNWKGRTRRRGGILD